MTLMPQLNWVFVNRNTVEFETGGGKFGNKGRKGESVGGAWRQVTGQNRARRSFAAPGSSLLDASRLRFAQIKFG